MGSIMKVSLSLPAELLAAAEHKRQARGESRSEFFRQAVAAFLRREQEREAVERYVRGYQEQPESDEEVLAVHHTSSAVLAQEPWE